MPPDLARTRKLLVASDFKTLFIEELGWNHHNARLEIPFDGLTITLSAVAEKCGMAAFVCAPGADGRIPDHAMRRKIERHITKRAHEHLIIFIDGKQTMQVWQWVRRERGKPAACREHTYQSGQPGDSLIQKLQALAVSLEEEECLTLIEVTGRARKAFDVERITKKFYDRFKAEHATFLKFLEGIPEEEMERWYVSVMLNRLMFIYFIQKKGFLNNDTDYLKNKLAQCRSELAKDRYYRDFLCPLFFEGFAKRKEERSDKAEKLLGEVPYLNGGIFMRHQIEQLHGKTISIPDMAFEKLFDFFDAYHWHLDERPLKADNEINPDVLGYIFEKYINQKQMGAYYTKEDISEYIGKDTVIPFLFDAAREKCKVAFEGERPIWGLLQEEPDRYIYPPIQHGVALNARALPAGQAWTPPKGLAEPLPLPPEIAAGLDDVSKRGEWNTAAPSEYALPTETWRELVARRKRYEETRAKLAGGEVRDINGLITFNLDIRQLAQDTIENADGPELIRAFWRALNEITVLDPACGSGAFLFAALNILEPLYEACLERMRFFLDGWGEAGKKNHPNYYKLFTEILKRVEDHPNPRYFIFKSIIVNNLYGVDIMEEAVEICKLRLFLKLVAQIERVGDIEPLPDIDFNIRAGNTLVGFASLAEVKKTQEGTLGFGKGEVGRLEEEAEIADRAFRKFREMQTDQGMSPLDFVDAKDTLRTRLKKLTDELDHFLASEYGVDLKKKDSFAKWRKSHQPFHWFAEFYGILKAGGFDVIIGNPPYVEYSKVKQEYTIRGYSTEECGNLYAFFVERSLSILGMHGRVGKIVQLPIVCTDRMKPLQKQIFGDCSLAWFANFDDRPARLFDGLQHIRATVFSVYKGIPDNCAVFSTSYNRWYSESRPHLFESLSFANVSRNLMEGAIPKIGIPQAEQVLARLAGSPTLKNYLVGNGRHLVYFHNSPQYWVRAMTFVPYFWNERDGEHISTQVKELRTKTADEASVVAALLNSSLFYWWYIILSDGRHLNLREIENFPAGLNQMSQSAKTRLSELTKALMADLKRHAVRKECSYKATGKVVYDEFYPRHSKPIIDEIDRVLAKHYSFTDEELDFIINYDIKYRLGLDGEEENEE